MIKDIVKNLELSSTLRINEISRNLELEGKKIYKFGFGQSPFQVPEDVVSELKNSAHQNKYLRMQDHEPREFHAVKLVLLLFQKK